MTESSAPPRAPQRTTRQKFDVWLRENIEAVVVAFIMALVIRCFCLEVFKIPTGSMFPTLYGAQEDGDRIVVNKLAYIFDPVERFDVAVFRYPLDTSKNYIKRVIGLPDEDLKIIDGDIFVRPHGSSEPFRLARKPLRTQQSLWILHPLPKRAKDGEEPLDVIDYSILVEWKIPKTVKAASDGFLLDAGTAEGKEAIHLAGPVENEYGGDDQTGDVVQDVKLDAQVTLEGDAPAAWLSLRERDVRFRLILEAGKPAVLETNRYGPRRGAGFDRTELPFSPPAGKTFHLEWMAFDGSLIALIDDAVVARVDYRSTEDDVPANAGAAHAVDGSDAEHSAFAAGALSGRCRLAGVRVFRDIHYIAENRGGAATVFSGKPELAVPARHYFVMGDHTTNSSDSRAWRARSVTVLEPDGSEHRYVGEERSSDPWSRGGGSGTIRLRDKWGVEHEFDRRKIVGDPTADFYPFVDVDELVGKPLIVFWRKGMPRATVIR